MTKIRRLSGGAKIIPVLKANAYGHGMEIVVEALRHPGVDMPAVMFGQEGFRLRAAGYRGPLLLLSCPSRKELEEILRAGMIPSVSSPAQARDVARAARRTNIKRRMAVEIDAGMARLGCSLSELEGIVSGLLTRWPGLGFGGVFAHFPRADIAPEETGRMGRKIRAGIIKAGLGQGPSHVSNSAALVRWGSMGMTHVRPGLAIYGVDPFPNRKKIFSPVLSLRSKVLQVRTVKRGTWVSYGRRYRAKKNVTLAVVGAGYADGIPRSLTGRGQVLIGGQRVSMTGAVCMDMVTCDVSRLRKVWPGQEAIFIGKSGAETITVEDMARWAGTIPYEILTGLGARVQRRATR